jgi:hypothetical protein
MQPLATSGIDRIVSSSIDHVPGPTEEYLLYNEDTNCKSGFLPVVSESISNWKEAPFASNE